MRNLAIYLACGAGAFIVGLVFDGGAPVIAATPAALTISTTALHTGRAGVAYSTTVAATGGVKPYSFSATGLPAGLTINKSTGIVSGTPGAGSFGVRTVSFKVTDSAKPTAHTAAAKLTLSLYNSVAGEACGGLNLGNNASFHGFVPFASTDAWDTDISDAPVDPKSDAITSAAGIAGNHLHHDWSSVADGNYGIPYTVVDSSVQPLVPIHISAYPGESDIAMAPFPLTAPIEGFPGDCAAGGWPDTYQGDAHVLVVDRNTCFLYETFNTHRCKGAWNADQETVWDLKQFEHRPSSWTSADAAGLAILPGLVRYDEVASGAIRHAIRFTLPHTKNDANDGYFVEPASHAAGTDWGVSNIMGMRIRLKADFDISGYSKTNQVILTAMKKYGMILADNGSYFYFQGAPDPRWNDDDLSTLDHSVYSSDFEVVEMTPAWPGWDSATAPAGVTPRIKSFSASATPVKAGATVVLAWDITGESYLFIDKLGGVRGSNVVVRPTATTTYTLNATNQFGRTKKTVTVTVN